MLNDLRVRERHTHHDRGSLRRTGKTRYRYFLGVKWSQVQILSARLRQNSLRAAELMKFLRTGRMH
jgi:hypothetical protein